MNDWPLYRSDQVRALDRRAIQRHGVDGYGLMQAAAAESLAVLQRHWPQARRIVVVAGGGNNGGDGVDLARQARACGLDPGVLLLADADQVLDKGSEASQALAAWQQTGEPVHAWSARWLRDADVVIDALFGTGLSRDIEGVAADAIHAINAAGKPVLALDGPSGLQADTGAVLGVAVRATVTVRFIGMTAGVLCGEGPVLAGQVELAPLPLPEPVRASEAPIARLMPPSELQAALPPRARDAHKGQFGHVLVIGGNHGMVGAALLAGRAALRAGAGLVSVATRPDHAGALLAAQAELMVHGVSTAEDLRQPLDAADCVAIGPGLGQDNWAQGLLAAALAAGKPLVIDADALNLLARDSLALPADAVLTPHPGEAGRLLNRPTAQVQAHRLQAVQDLQTRWGAHVVLKGQGSLVSDPDGPPWWCAAGNPGMATGGMGDVLTGVIAALIGQGVAPAQAARLGVMAHAHAGDVAARGGERGLLPSDLIDALRGVINPE